MVVVTAVLPWTAKGAAAPSSARQFNRRRDNPTTEALSQPFVVFVNDNPTPRYRLTREQAYELLTSLQRALGIVKTG